MDWDRLLECKEATEWTDGVRVALGLARFGIHISFPRGWTAAKFRVALEKMLDVATSAWVLYSR
jgi:hypothetical protein